MGSVAELNSTDEASVEVVAIVTEVNGVGGGTGAPSEAVSVETNSGESVDVGLGEVLSSEAGAVPSGWAHTRKLVVDVPGLRHAEGNGQGTGGRDYTRSEMKDFIHLFRVFFISLSLACLLF